MKKSLSLYLLPLALLAAGCSADEIDFYDDSTSSTDSLTDPGLAWNASTCEVTIGTSNTFPTLTNEYRVKVAYTSSNTDIATIDSNGTITLVAAGTTTITASNTATSTYSASSAAYTLTIQPAASSDTDTPTVPSGADEGAGTYTFNTTGDPSSDDDISNTTFSRMITVTFAAGGASVTGDYYGYVTVSGNQVTVNNTGSENIVYKLTGSASDGFFKLYSTKKQAILLSGLTLTNPSGAAINNQSGIESMRISQGIR